MKLKVLHKTMAAAAAALLIAGCGGGGGGGGSTPSLELSGTAATGAALALATVDVKCAAGNGTATTTAIGGYTVTIENGSLPCIIKVSGTNNNGVAVTLHSVADAAAGNVDGKTTALANVTPITEMIVAQLTAAMPGDIFANFNPQVVTTTALTTATTAIVAALQAAGIDFAAIDPLKGTLVAGSSANPYDVLLDRLGETITAESLPLLVNQIATAAVTNSTTGLTEAMAAVSGGALAGCPQALSGKYRSVEYTGGTSVHTVDFKAMTLTTEGVAETIVAGSQACEFSVGPTKIVVGPQGAGAFQASDMAGFFFPVQAHTVSSVTGTWNFLESGLNESNAGEHFFGKFTINADGSASVCEHEVMNGVASFGSCVTDTDETVTVQAASDGSFNLQYGTDAAKIYGYRGPNGALNLFGTSNAEGNASPTALRTHFVMTRPRALEVPAVGTVTKFWDLSVSFASGTLTGGTLAGDSVTVTESDTAGSSYTRQRTSDGRIDTFKVNYPVEGLRFREATTGISSVYLLPIPNLGLAVAIDNMPSHFYAISVTRP